MSSIPNHNNAVSILDTLSYCTIIPIPSRSWPLSRSSRPYLPRHLLRSLSLQSLQCLLLMVFHHSLLLEVCDLSTNPLAHILPYPIHSLQTPPPPRISTRDQGIATYPTRSTIRLEPPPLTRTRLLRLVFLSNTVNDAMLVQTPEIHIPRLPAPRSLRPVGGYRRAI